MAFLVSVLGSGTIVPTGLRRATSILVETRGERLLLDCGPGALDAVERLGRSWREIDAVLLTHYHPDHTLDLGRLLAAANADPEPGPLAPIRIAGPPGLAQHLDRWRALFPSTAERRRRLETFELASGDVPLGGGISASCAGGAHGDHPSLAYRLTRGGRSLVYTGDTSYTGSLARFAARADLLVAECSFPDDRAAEGHLTPREAGRLAAEAGAARLLLVHLYPVYGALDPAAIARERYSGPAETARDGLQIDLES